MNPDVLKTAWLAQASQRRLTIDADVLLKEVQHNERNFRRTIFWRDVREVGVSLVLVPVWLWLGLTKSLPWTWYLCIPALLWIAGFMVADRMNQKPRQPRSGDPLRAQIESSLAQVEHQIWLLRNVLWWYLLPPGAAMALFFAQCAWLSRTGGVLAVLIMAGVITVAGVILVGIYWLNRNCVRKDLEPRRRELAALLHSLTEKEHLGNSSAGDNRT